MIKIIFILLLLLCAQGFAMDPPSILWTKHLFSESYGEFYDVHETHDGGFIVAGGHLLVAGGSANKSLYRFTHEGDTLWSAGAEGYEYQAGFWVEELADGSLIAAGGCGLVGAPTTSVMLFKTDGDGNQIWTKAYDFPGTNDQGNCVIALDDGYAIAGDQGDKAWIIRTDLQGDSIWTATFEQSTSVDTRRILLVDNTLIVFYNGLKLGILAYSIDDGQLLWENDNFDIFSSGAGDYGDMTLATTDNGYTFISKYFPNIVHTDSFGNIQWYYGIPYFSQPYGYSINSTMDGGYIYGGENTPNVEPPPGIQAGMVVKFDSEGNEQWRDYVYETDVVKCIRQLSSGGYITCGGEGSAELIRYEPESSIEVEGGTSSTSITSLFPNPFSSTLNIEFTLSEASNINLTVFDLSGRLVANIEQGVFPAGEHSSLWNPSEISSGCYLVRLSNEEGSFVKNCVFIP